jgi:hypothetical protein
VIRLTFSVSAIPTRQRVVTAGNSRSDSGGNEAAEGFDGKGCLGQLREQAGRNEQTVNGSVSIEIRGKRRIQKGEYYRVAGYEAGVFSGSSSSPGSQAQQPFQFRSFFVVTQVIDSQTK